VWTVASRVGVPVSAVQACDDPRLLNVRLTLRQRELLQAIEDNQTVVCSAGRQSGKTMCAAISAVVNLCLRPDLDEIAAGSTRHALVVAQSRDQASILLSYARRLLEDSPLLSSMIVGGRDDRIILAGNRQLLAMPCSDRHLRGLSASMVTLDEAAHFLSETSGPAVAEAIYRATRPSLLRYGTAGRMILLSTPLAAEGLFYRMHSQAESGELPDAVAFTAKTADMSPSVSQEFLAGERLMLGEADYAREYEAKFGHGSSGAFFEREQLADVVGRYKELPADAADSWVLGFDPAFAGDPAAAAVVGRSRTDPSRLLVGRVQQWKPATKKKRRGRQTTDQHQVVVDAVLDAVAAMSAEYGNAVVLTDAHLPAVVLEGLRARGVRRVEVRAWTGVSRTAAFRAVRARVYANTITLPDDPGLVDELCSLRTRLRSGGSQVEIPRSGGSHADRAIALASAVLEIDSRGVNRPLHLRSAHDLRERPQRVFPAGELERQLGFRPQVRPTPQRDLAWPRNRSGWGK